ncbi:MAG: PCMD domain-containing protein [Paludibacteraceae bacterium]|nr:PCMD domain-containing protein [Paludibacteraceae bacterium]
MRLKVLIVFSIIIYSLQAQKIVPIKYGHFENWIVRHIQESRLLGGQLRTLYAIGPTDTIDGNTPWIPKGTPWATSNAYASPAGIDKGSNSVVPEKRGNGTCARMDVKLETVRAFGFVDIEVVVAGSIFLGKLYEPIKSTSDPYKNMDMGIPYTKRPKALIFDYKVNVSDEQTMTKALGIKHKTVPGHDMPEVFVYLQKRWEDKNGNIHALRVGTARWRFTKTETEWHNNFRLPIRYGDITSLTDFRPYEKLGFPFNMRNSKGKMTQVIEEGWADADETPTHLVVFISSGCQPAFIGHIGNTLCVDNVKLEE